MPKGHKLVDEHPLLVERSLACAAGLNEAIFLQRVHSLCAEGSGCKTSEDGYVWVPNTYEQWRADHFPFWSISTLRRIVQSCIEKRVLVTLKPSAANFDHTLWYRVNVEAIALFVGAYHA